MDQLSISKQNSDRSKILIEGEKFLYQDKNQEVILDFAKIVHDIKGPLNSMKGLLELAKTDVQSDIGRQYLDMIEDCRKKLDSRIRQSLDHLSNRGHIPSVLINFNEIIDNIRVVLGNLEGFSSIRFNIEIDNKSPFFSDQDAIFSILQNIIENSVKYRRKDLDTNEINISITDSDAGIQLKISDNGKGIRQDLIPTIFEFNVKEDDNKENGSSGMGLAIVRDLISKINGCLYMDTKVEEGTTFYIEIPCQNKDAE